MLAYNVTKSYFFSYLLGTFKLREDEKLRRWFSSLLFFECTTCLKRLYLQTSNHPHSSTYTWTASDSADVNKRMTFAACEVGLGRESVNMMADIRICHML